VESLCDDPEVLDANIHMKLSRSPDYEGWSYETAKADFLARIDKYQSAYTALDSAGDSEHSFSYIKLINLSSHLVAHRVYGSMTMSLMPYLMAIHIDPRPVWLVRMAQSSQDTGGKSPVIFGDQAMSDDGRDFAMNFAAFVQRRPQMGSARFVVCSHRRALDMARLMDPTGKRTCVHAFLNPMDWGIYEGVRMLEFRERTSPEFYQAFCRDPMNTRFPGGESYMDFVRRLMTVLVEIEQQLEPVIVIAPRTTLQVLHCYFGRNDVGKASEVAIDPHSVVEWRPDGGRFACTVYAESDVRCPQGVIEAPERPCWHSEAY